MLSKQLSESLNVDFKGCMKPHLDVIQFFKHFERVVGDLRYKELQCEFESKQKAPRLKLENSLCCSSLHKFIRLWCLIYSRKGMVCTLQLV